MSALKEMLLSGVRPSEAFQKLIGIGDLSGTNLIKMIDEEFDGMPAAVIHAIANWNKGNNPDRKGAMNSLTRSSSVR